MDSATKFILGLIALAIFAGVIGSAIPSTQFLICVGALLVAVLFGMVRIGKVLS